MSRSFQYLPSLDSRYLESGAVLSDDGGFRYRLWRKWAPERRSALFVMLNPSTADAGDDDPTIRKCVGFAKRYNYGGIEVVNLFAFRATRPSELRSRGWAIGDENDRYIRAVASCAFDAICAWGANVENDLIAARRASAVVSMLHDQVGLPLRVLGLTKGGQPRHPLMLPYNSPLTEWVPAC